MESKVLQQQENKQMSIIHTVAPMSDIEREIAKRRIGNDLYEIFLRIQEELKLDNEFL